MEMAIRIALGVVGLVLVIWVQLTAILTFVVPRAQRASLSAAIFLLIRIPFDMWVRRFPDSADGVLALYAPFALVALPIVWAFLVGVGFALQFFALGIGSWSEAFVTSGSSLLTLGFARPQGAAAMALTFCEALMGLGIVALVIGYLPTIYGAFARREVLVGSLEAPAGVPPSAVEMLVRHELIGLTHRYERIWSEWQQWFADVEESHSSQMSLPFFRSPQPGLSWVTAAGCVLDAASLLNAVVDRPATPDSRLLIRQGFLTMRRIAGNYQLPFPADPQQGDPISITREEFDAALGELEAAGVPLKADRDQAWLDWAGWRVNYDAALLGLCVITWAPPARWSSDRARLPMRPPLLGRRARTKNV